MTLASIEPFTMRDLLFPGAEATDQIRQRFDERGVLESTSDAMRRVPNPLVRAASAEVVSLVAGVLEMDLVDVFVSAWKKLGALSEAAEATLWNPGEEQVVNLATHEISWTYAPSVQLILDGVPIGSLDTEIEVGATVHALCAVVANGSLTGVRSGRVEIAASLSCEGVGITSVRRDIDPSLEIDLRGGVRLIDPPSYVVIPELQS